MFKVGSQWVSRNRDFLVEILGYSDEKVQYRFIWDEVNHGFMNHKLYLECFIPLNRIH